MYTLIMNKVLHYKLIINSFSKTDTLVFKINETFKISAYLKALLKLNCLMKIYLTPKFLKLSVFSKMNTSINTNGFKFKYTLKSKEKFSTIINLYNKIAYDIRAKLKILIQIKQNIKIDFTPIVGRFYTLRVYDPQTLNSLDNRTLNSLDFNIL